MNADRRIAGIIVLAGGKSSRMGRDKARIDWKGAPLIQSVIGSLSSLNISVCIVAEMEADYGIAGARTVSDLTPGEGPIGGVITGLSKVQEGWHIVVACDMPFLIPELFDLLLQEAGANSCFDVIAPMVAGGIEPLCALYHTSALPGLRAFFDTGDRSAKRALKYLRVCEVGEDRLRMIDPNLVSFTNINTPEDLSRVKSTGKALKEPPV